MEARLPQAPPQTPSPMRRFRNVLDKSRNGLGKSRNGPGLFGTPIKSPLNKSRNGLDRSWNGVMNRKNRLDRSANGLDNSLSGLSPEDDGKLLIFLYVTGSSCRTLPMGLINLIIRIFS